MANALQDIVSRIPTFGLLRRVKDFFSKGWSIIVQHNYMEGNKCVNQVVNYSLNFDLVLCKLGTIPLDLRNSMLSDVIGVITLWFVCL